MKLELPVVGKGDDSHIIVSTSVYQGELSARVPNFPFPLA